MQEYQRKRNFARTPEPAPSKRPGNGELIFVVHKHAARRLHYDLRLEIDDVLKSWALPHGPSADPGVKRLAVMVEDHPLEYAGFEGVIPAGEYGAGQVIIWDSGTYVPVKGGEQFSGDRSQAMEILREGLTKGKVIVFFYGQKLKGEFTLVKMQQGKNNWLFLKHRDAYATTTGDILNEEASVSSGRTIEDLKAGISPVKSKKLSPEKMKGARKAGFPQSISPMLATLAEGPFSGPDWFFEPKLDGYRTIGFIKDGTAKLLSRRGIDVTGQYIPLAEDLKKYSGSEMVIDGEIIALDTSGKVCFQCLQNYLETFREARSSRQPVTVPLIYYVFDILYLDGYDLTRVPLLERKLVLENRLKITEGIRLVERFSGDGKLIYQAAIENGLEGVIAKRQESLYEPGRRSRNWIKLKGTLRDEFIIGGYSKGMGSRAGTFGALLLGQYDSKGDLVYAGHVGTGFDETLLNKLLQRLKPLITDNLPFSSEPPLNTPTTWVRPELIAEVKYSQRTREGILRAPVFLHLRDDKPAAEVKASSPVKIDDPPPEEAASSVTKNIVRQLQNRNEKFDLDVEGSKVPLNNLDKTLWPADGSRPALTKRDLLIYLARVSPYLLPHLHDRLITLSRYPDGISGGQFYQKHWGHPLHDFVTRVPITTEHEGKREYMVCNNTASLMWLGQIADIELHTWFSRIAAKPDPPEGDITDIPDKMIRFPDFMVFDLDPYVYSGKEKSGAEPELNRQAFLKVCETAGWLKEVLDNLSLSAFIKTSGKTGLHIFVPLKRQFNYDEVRSAARTICIYVNQKHPRDTTIEWTVDKRTGKIFLDYNQNTFGKTLASVYSPRPTPLATVSTALKWDELGNHYPTDFTITGVPDRLTETGDPWADISKYKNDLKKLINL
jgi:bifunctional non-homologous end joining protein LigD